MIVILRSRSLKLTLSLARAQGKDFHSHWPGALYVDVDGLFFKALGGGRFLRPPLLRALLPWSKEIKRYRSAKANGVRGNLKGNGTRAGGVFVINRGELGIEFVHAESTLGESADREQLMAAVHRAAVKQGHDSALSKVRE